jgi:superfamily I DNA and/or RNA helicase
LVWVEVDAPEMLAGTSRVNPTEVEAVRAVLSCLAGSQGFADFQRHWTKPEDQEVALITFYGRQVRLLKEVEAEFASRVPTRLQTVDKFQGMERNIVVVSLVRSDMLAYAHPSTPDLDTYPDSYGYPPQPSLGFAQSPNRLNVALSRAKRLLVIVGNSRHFSRHDCYRRVYETVQARGRVVPYTNLLPYLSA